MPRRLVVLLILALLAVGVAYMANQALSGKKGPVSLPGKPSAAVETGPKILVAKRAIAYGQRALAEDFAWADWPKAGLNARFLTEAAAREAPTELVGQVAKVDIGIGDPIVRDRFVAPESGGVVAALLAPGMRAFAISIDEERGVGGLIQPLDRVDVLVSREIEIVSNGDGGRRNEVVSEVLIENVKVLAMDQQIAPDPEAPGIKGDTATLEVTPEQALLLQKAASAGTLSLLSRSIADARGTPDAKPRTRTTNLSKTVGVREGVVIFRGDQQSVETGAK